VSVFLAALRAERVGRGESPVLLAVDLEFLLAVTWPFWRVRDADCHSAA
jgi:hypothetical protein